MPLSLRLTGDMEARLTQCAERLKLPKHSVAQAAIEAAVEAIEANDFKLVLPLEFEPKNVPVEKRLAPTVKTGPDANIVPLPFSGSNEVLSPEGPAHYG